MIALTEADLADQADTLGVNHPLIPRCDAADARPAPAEFSPAGSGAGECEVDQAAMRHVEGCGLLTDDIRRFASDIREAIEASRRRHPEETQVIIAAARPGKRSQMQVLVRTGVPDMLRFLGAIERAAP